MNTILITALLQVVSAAPAVDTKIALQLVAPWPASTRVRLEFISATGAAPEERTIAFEKGKASAIVPAGVVAFRALGPEIFSELAILQAERNEILPLSTALLRLDGVVAPEGRKLTLFAFGSVIPESRPAAWNVVEIARGETNGKAWTRFRLPVGHYALAVERGPAPPVLVGEAQMARGQEVAAEVKPVESRRLVLRVLEGIDRKPVKGARLVEVTLDTPNRALSALLARRAGQAGENGLLGVGLMPAATPSRLRVGASGFRVATLKLGAGFEEGRRDVILAPNWDVEIHVTGLSARPGETRPEVSLSRCRYQRANSGCDPTAAQSKHLDLDWRTRFSRVEGGEYQVEVMVPGLGKSRQTVEVASDGEGEVFPIEIALAERTLRGATRLRGGTPVPAHVQVLEWTGIRASVIAETTSHIDGTFELQTVVRDGNKMALFARSDDPIAATPFNVPVPIAGGFGVLEGIELELDSTGLEIAVHDARTNEPISGCPVAVTWSGKGSEQGGPFKGVSDSSGFVHVHGLGGGSAHATVQCAKYFSKDLDEVEVVRDETRHVEVLLQEANDLILVAKGEDGAPVAGATILIDAYSRLRGLETAGSTDAQGELIVKGDAYGGEAAFVIAPGRAMAMQILPVPASCDRRENCRVPILLRNPSPFAGLTVRTESGQPLALGDLDFSGGGISIPPTVLFAVLSANGLPVGAPAFPLEVPVASLFPPGDYVLTVSFQRPDPKTRKLTSTVATVGVVTVPELEKVELTVHDGPPPAKVQEKVTAAAAR